MSISPSTSVNRLVDAGEGAAVPKAANRGLGDRTPEAVEIAVAAREVTFQSIHYIR
jgi:hypothetical protein